MSLANPLVFFAQAADFGVIFRNNGEMPLLRRLNSVSN